MYLHQDGVTWTSLTTHLDGRGSGGSGQPCAAPDSLPCLDCSLGRADKVLREGDALGSLSVNDPHERLGLGLTFG